jgi:flagella basal body P-ring formation protein FlgA
MNTKTTFFRRLHRHLPGFLAALCFLTPGARTLADAFTLPEKIIDSITINSDWEDEVK